MDLLIGLLVFVALMGLLTWYYNRRPPNFPPGPLTPPIVGGIPFVTREAYRQFAKYQQQYGGMFSVMMGNQTVLVCPDWKSVKAMFQEQGENFINRPFTIIADEIMHNNDIATSGGPIWKERKRFCLYHFKNFGFGKVKMEEYIMEETEKLVEYVKANGPKKIDVTYLFFIPLLNVIWRFVGGKRFEASDKRMAGFVADIITLFENGNANNVFVFMPYLRHFPIIRTVYQKLKAGHDNVSKFIEEEVDDHMKTFQEGHNRDLMDAFIAQMRKTDQTKEKAEKFRKEVLIGMSYDFFNAAVDAGNHTLAWGMLYMATWRDMQTKVQEELDRVIGRDRLPTYPDRSRLIYTEAVLQEIMRYSSVAPLSVPHCSLAPTKVLGFDIPKDTFVIESIWGVHFDPELWGDPEVFRPERFITETGELFRPEYLIPFGTGARMCMGEPLGRAEMFLIFSGLLHQFNVFFVSGEVPPTFKAVVGLNARPEDFGLSFRPR